MAASQEVLSRLFPRSIQLPVAMGLLAILTCQHGMNVNTIPATLSLVRTMWIGANIKQCSSAKPAVAPEV